MEERLNHFIEGLGISINAFEKEIGVGTGTINKTILNGKSLGSEIIKKIVLKYPSLDLQWLFTGKEYIPKNSGTFQSMSFEKPPIKTTNEATNVTKTENILGVSESIFQYQRFKALEGRTIRIPIMDTYAGASTQGFLTQGHIEEIDSIVLPAGMLQNGGKYVCLKVKGESMMPTLLDNDYIVAKLVESSDYQNIKNHCIYAVVTQNQDMIIKRIQNNIDAGHILCYPDNIYHSATRVPYQDVFQVFEVVARLTNHLEQSPLLENLDRMFKNR